MTFIEEELEAVEKTPQYRRVLKVLLKYQIYTLCQKLSDVGEESYVVTASVSDGTFSNLGSRKGQTYVEKLHDAEWKFLSFCSGRGADDQPQEFEELPEHSQHYEDVSQAYEENAEEAEQDPSDFDSRDAPSEEVDDGNASESHYVRVSSSRMRYGLHQAEGPEQETHQTIGRQDEYTDLPRGQQHPTPRIPVNTSRYQFLSEHQNDSFNNRFQVKIEPGCEMHPVSGLTLKQGTSSCPDNQTSLGDDSVTSGKDYFDSAMSVDFRGTEKATDYEATKASMTMTDHGRKYRFNSSDLDSDQSSRYSPGFIEGETVQSEFHVCPVCKEQFPDAKQLTVHLRIHVVKGTHQCPVCFKTFKQSSNLYVHQRLHTGERPFKCSVCDRSFAQANTLTFHMRKHTGDKPYRCPVCGKAFIQSSGLNSHMRQHNKWLKIEFP